MTLLVDNIQMSLQEFILKFFSHDYETETTTLHISAEDLFQVCSLDINGEVLIKDTDGTLLITRSK